VFIDLSLPVNRPSKPGTLQRLAATNRICRNKRKHHPIFTSYAARPIFPPTTMPDHQSFDTSHALNPCLAFDKF